MADFYTNYGIENFLRTRKQDGRRAEETGLQTLISFVWNIFTLVRYNTFLHTFLCSTTYQKLVFYAGIPLNTLMKKWKRKKKTTVVLLAE